MDEKVNSAAVQARAQHQKESKSVRPLKVTVVDALNITPDKLKELHESDEKLQKSILLSILRV